MITVGFMMMMIIHVVSNISEIFVVISILIHNVENVLHILVGLVLKSLIFTI